MYKAGTVFYCHSRGDDGHWTVTFVGTERSEMATFGNICPVCAVASITLQPSCTISDYLLTCLPMMRLSLLGEEEGVTGAYSRGALQRFSCGGGTPGIFPSAPRKTVRDSALRCGDFLIILWERYVTT